MPVQVSVVMPAYQAEAFVAQGIASALAQSLTDLEVVVVDDCSTDGTWDVLQRCAREDPRVVALRQPRRSGASAARNVGITRARGRWVALLDADDLFLPQRLERMVERAEAEGADLLGDDLLKSDFTTGAPLGRAFGDEALTFNGPLPLAELVRRDMPGQERLAKFGFLQPIMRRAFLLEHGLRYAEDVGVGEDFLLYFEAVARGGRFHLMPEAHYIYRLRPGSVSNHRGCALHLSKANERMVRIAEGLGDAELLASLHQRQRLLDFDSFVLATESGTVGAALRYARFDNPAVLLRQARVAAGAARNRFRAWRAAASARASCARAKPPR